MSAIKNLTPQLVWKNFYAICQIPHPSGHLIKITDFIVEFAQKLKLAYKIDKRGNILILKNATKGKEGLPSLILQAHLDMVPQKNTGVHHDFETDSLDVYVDGEWVKARNTTLGADNGIGVAAALGILESQDIEHPALEVLLTVDEETGMFGALALEKDFLSGKTLLNLDSEEEGELYIGCSGGVDAEIEFLCETKKTPKENKAMQISLKGLLGGHSGLDIDKKRGNANMLMCQFLETLIDNKNVCVSSIKGGNLHNAIPRECVCVICFSVDEKDYILHSIKTFQEKLKAKFSDTEPTFSFEEKECELPETIFVSTKNVINGILKIPNGVISMMKEMPEVVETSNNLSIINTMGNYIQVQYLLRSTSADKQEKIKLDLQNIASSAGATIYFTGEYPGWEPNKKSELLRKMTRIYENQFGKKPSIKVIHAGLECGIIKSIYPEMDMISFGPTIVSPHSPDEKVNIKSVSIFWEYLQAAIQNI